MGMVLAGDAVYAVGVPTSQDPAEASELWVMDGNQGTVQQTLALPGQPVYDGISASGGRLYVTTSDGQMVCFGGAQ